MSYKYISDIIELKSNEQKKYLFKKYFFNKKPVINVTSYNNNCVLLKNINKNYFEILNCTNEKIKINFVAIESNITTKTIIINEEKYINLNDSIINYSMFSYETTFSYNLNNIISNYSPLDDEIIFEIYQQPQFGNLYITNNQNISYIKDAIQIYENADFIIKAKLKNNPDIYQLIYFNITLELQKYINLSSSYINETISFNTNYQIDLESLISTYYPTNENILFEVSNNPQYGTVILNNNNLTYNSNQYYGNDSFFIKYYFENFINTNAYVSFNIIVNNPEPLYTTIGNNNFASNSNSYTALLLKYNNNYTSNSTGSFQIPTISANNEDNYFTLDLQDNSLVDLYLFIQNSTEKNLYYINDMNDIENTKIQKGPITSSLTYNSGVILNTAGLYYFWYNQENNAWYYSNERFPYL